MKDFCIVRAKINPETGRPLISLASKTEKLVSITLTPHERLIYDHVRGISFSCYLTKLMRLRQGIHSIAVHILYLTMLWSSMWPRRPPYRGIIYWKRHDWRGYNCRPASQVRHLLLASFDNSMAFFTDSKTAGHPRRSPLDLCLQTFIIQEGFSRTRTYHPSCLPLSQFWRIVPQAKRLSFLSVRSARSMTLSSYAYVRLTLPASCPR